MREIKFRAWLDDGRFKWMEDDFYIHSDGTIYDEASTTYDTPNKEIEQAYNLTIMQYTGLKDKNGVEIYEGDIVLAIEDDEDSCCGNVFEYKLEIKFANFGWAFDDHKRRVLGENNRWKYCRLGNCNFELEVIGNIYENPELLEA